MTKKQLNKAQKQLEAKLADLNGTSDHREMIVAERANDPMDTIQSRVDLDLVIRNIDSGWRTKKLVMKALTAIKDGEYGVCQECGEDINPRRLEAIPWTMMCVSCQEAHDEQGHESDDYSWAA